MPNPIISPVIGEVTAEKRNLDQLAARLIASSMPSPGLFGGRVLNFKRKRLIWNRSQSQFRHAGHSAPAPFEGCGVPLGLRWPTTQDLHQNDDLEGGCSPRTGPVIQHGEFPSKNTYTAYIYNIYIYIYMYILHTCVMVMMMVMMRRITRIRRMRITTMIMIT